MKGTLLVLFVICASVAAMVPRERRAMPTEEEPSTTKKPEICAPTTPCAWDIYKHDRPDLIEISINNIYCTCSEFTVCRVYLDDPQANAYVHRCLPPEEGS